MTIKRLKNTPVYHLLSKMRTSHTGRLLEGLPNRSRYRHAAASKKPYTIDICSRMGFGATLTNIVSLHSFLNTTETDTVNIVAHNPLYTSSDGQDLIQTYFRRQIHSAPPSGITIKYRFYEDLSLTHPAAGLTIEKAHELFHTFYAVKDVYLEEARDYLSLLPKVLVGVHFRGSDKISEAPRVGWDSYARNSEIALRLYKADGLFIATDEPDFISFMRECFGEELIFTYDCKHYSNGRYGAHFTGAEPKELGREALLTILILSQCCACVRGASHLSAWAKILNPTMPILMLNEPTADALVFPEGQIYAEYQAKFKHLV